MFRYYLVLGIRNSRPHPALTATDDTHARPSASRRASRP